MTLRTSHAFAFLFCLCVAVLAVSVPSASAATQCVNGFLVDDFGITQGQCSDVSLTGTGDVNFSDTYAYKRNGVFGCSLNGSYSMSVGALSAVGGVYVPVNDAAVTLNTGYLVYKECVLRGVVIRQREAATAGTQKQVISALATGRDGNPLYSELIPREELQVADETMLRLLENNYLNTVDPAFLPQVKRGIAQRYVQARNASNQQFKCGYSGDIKSVLEGRAFSFEALDHLLNPACNPYYAYQIANNSVQQVIAADVENLRTKLLWGQGTFPVERIDEFGNRITVTPGNFVQSNALQVLQTGYKQLENANDIDQMVGALFSGITSQVIGDSRGIAGLLQKTGSQPSYIDQVVKESAQGLRDSAANAALQILSAAKQIENGFKLAMEAIAKSLSDAIIDLRTKEAACWKLVVDAVCATPLAADKTCTSKASGSCTQDDNGIETCPTGFKLKIATSTQASQAVISSRITSLASTTVTNIARADQAIVLVDRLIVGITNSASLDAQRVALQQLDNLVAQRQLHTQYDLQGAQSTAENIDTSMQTLRTDTVKDWADSTIPETGWCNVNNPATLEFWKLKWKVTS